MHSMYRNRAIIYLLVALLSHALGHAQEGRSIFNFLNLPTSSHALALGGKNITIVDDVITTGATVREAILTIGRAGGRPATVSVLSLALAGND